MDGHKNMNPNPNAQPPNGASKDGNPDPWESLRGTKDANGVPQHPEEKAEFYKKKSDESNREASKIIETNKSLTEELNRFKTVPPVIGDAHITANELSTKIPDWNTLSPQQQTAILNSYGSLHSDLASIKKEVAKIVDKQTFDAGYNSLVQDPNFARLAEFKEEFIARSYEKENLRTPLKILATAFLAEKGAWGVPASSDDDDEDDEGRSGLDDGTAGNSAPPSKNGTYTSAEAMELRKTDPRKYMRLIRTRKLVIKD